MFKALMTALIEHGKIKTTEAKAKSLSVYADKMVTLAKKRDIASRKLMAQTLGTQAVKSLFDWIAPLFEDVKGGYTRIIKLSPRRSDGSPMSIIEFTKAIPVANEKEKEDKKDK